MAIRRGCKQQTKNHQGTAHPQDPRDPVWCASLYKVILFQAWGTLASIFPPQPLRQWRLGP